MDVDYDENGTVTVNEYGIQNEIDFENRVRVQVRLLTEVGAVGTLIEVVIASEDDWIRADLEVELGIQVQL
jgi:hypothetical protein